MAKYKLHLGDCLPIMKDMQENSVDFTLTDIPYEKVNRDSNGLRNLDKGTANDQTFNLFPFLEEVYRVTKNSVCIFCGKEQFSYIYEFFAKQKGTTRPVIWQKSNPSPMNGEFVYLSGCELAVWFKKRGAKVFNARCKNTVFKHPNGSSKLFPCEKNHELLAELITDNTNVGDTVFDPCTGSGSHLLMALRGGRNAVGVEINEEYHKLATERLEAEYGK